MKKTLLTLGIALAALTSATNSLKAQSSSDAPSATSSVVNIATLDQNIRDAWDNLQRFMTVDFLQNGGYSGGVPLEFIKEFYLNNILKAQYSILAYQSAVTNKHVFLKKDSEYFSQFTSHTDGLETDTATEISNDDFTNTQIWSAEWSLFSSWWQNLLEGRVGIQFGIFYDTDPLRKPHGFEEFVDLLKLKTTPLASFKDFKEKLNKNYQSAVDNYRTRELATSIVNTPAELEQSLEHKIDVEMDLSCFSLLKDNLLYSYLHLMVIESRASVFCVEDCALLEQELDQLLNNLDVTNPIALLQAQVNIIYCEQAISQAIHQKKAAPSVTENSNDQMILALNRNFEKKNPENGNHHKNPTKDPKDPKKKKSPKKEPDNNGDNFTPGVVPGFTPGVVEGFTPGVNPGETPGINPGNPDNHVVGNPEGREVGKTDGTPGVNPGETPGVNPGEIPGIDPGKTDQVPGVNPGETPGVNPAETPGVNPGETPGINPGDQNHHRGGKHHSQDGGN